MPADWRCLSAIRSCVADEDLPGQELLQYFDEDEELRVVSSGDVNDYRREIVGCDVSAKDFGAWAGAVLMARHCRARPSLRLL
jgi:DNA topoisomerase I